MKIVISAILTVVLAGTPTMARSAVGCIGNDSESCRWTTLDYGLQGSFLALTFADWAVTSTAAASHSRPFEETNPILGKHPTQGRLAAYFLGVSAGHTAISMVLPRPWRTVWQGVWIGIGVDTMVIWGGSVSFPF